ncbi:hypothetical protein ACT2CV_05120 [Pasteurellaceae bacterium 22721_9_1]
MKKIILFILCFGVVACSEKNKEYYLANPDKAEQKWQQCRKAMDNAFMSNDKSSFEKTEKDPECKASREAIIELRKQKEEQERLEKEAKEKAAIEEARQKLDQEFGQLDWQEFTRQFVNTQCATNYIREDDYPCRALKSIYDEKTSKAKAELTKLTFADLLGQEKQYCGRDQRKFSACSVWEEAITEVGKSHFDAIPFQELEKINDKFCVYDGRRLAACHIFEKVKKQKGKEIINAYVQNYDGLKQDYNQCVKRLAEIGDNWKKYKEREAVSNYYPCPQARDARSQLGLPYDNFKTLME